MVLSCEDPEGRSKVASSGIEFTVEGTRTPTAVTWAPGFSAYGCLRPLRVVGCCPPNVGGGDGHVLGSNFTRALLVDVGLFQRCGYWQLLKRRNSMDHHDNCLHPEAGILSTPRWKHGSSAGPCPSTISQVCASSRILILAWFRA